MKVKNNREIKLKGEDFWDSLDSLFDTIFLFFCTGLVLLLAIAAKSIVSKLWEGELLPALSAVLVMTIFVIMNRKMGRIGDDTPYTLNDFVVGSYAKFVAYYSYDNSRWAIFCPIDESPSGKNIIHVPVNQNFSRRFSDKKNMPVRFVATRGDMTEADKQKGVWPIAFDEVLGEFKSLRCKEGDDRPFAETGRFLSEVGKTPTSEPVVCNRAQELISGCRGES